MTMQESDLDRLWSKLNESELNWLKRLVNDGIQHNKDKQYPWVSINRRM